MELSCICYRLAPYLRNLASRLIKSPKFYLGDAGLACFLAEVEELAPDNPLKGGNGGNLSSSEFNIDSAFNLAPCKYFLLEYPRTL